MGRGNVDNPEKDPSLFPESRVRPWVVDKDAEEQMEEILDNFDKTLTLISPIKDGLGASAFDRTLRDDNRSELFFAELAALRAQKELAEARAATGLYGLQTVGEIFEDLYRETHGLPLRKKQLTNVCSGVHDVEPQHERREDMPVDPSGAEENELAMDSEVARLLAALQIEFDADFDESNGEIEEGDGEVVEGGDKDDDELSAGKEKKQGNCDDKGTRDRRCESDKQLEKTTGEAKTRSSQPDHRHQGEREGDRVAETDRRAQDDTVPPERQENRNSSGLLLPHTQQGRIDIGRMKIDGSERGSNVGPRPHSAPSACMSAGGFSRLSRASSSNLSRTVSQKLLKATKEVHERESSEAQEVGGKLRQTPGFAIAQADDRINVVKQNADALQARMSVKRRSYLKGGRLRAVRWLPRDKYVRHPPPRFLDGAEKNAQSMSASGRERPQSATSRRRCPPEALASSCSTPLLNNSEAAFLFGNADDEAVAKCPPSLRQTTLGRMLRRTAPSESDLSYSRNKPQEYSLSNCRPSSADTGFSCHGVNGGKNRSEYSYKVEQTKPNVKNSVRNRPSSAASACRRQSPSAADLSSTKKPALVDGKKYHMGSRKGPPLSPKRKGVILTTNFPAKNQAVGQTIDNRKGRQNGGERLRNRESKPTVNIHKALEATLRAAADSVPPLEQFINSRNIITEMKQINTKDSTGGILLNTQGLPKARIKEECWVSETGREYKWKGNRPDSRAV